MESLLLFCCVSGVGSGLRRPHAEELRDELLRVGGERLQLGDRAVGPAARRGLGGVPRRRRRTRRAARSTISRLFAVPIQRVSVSTWTSTTCLPSSATVMCPPALRPLTGRGRACAAAAAVFASACASEPARCSRYSSWSIISPDGLMSNGADGVIGVAAAVPRRLVLLGLGDLLGPAGQPRHARGVDRLDHRGTQLARRRPCRTSRARGGRRSPCRPGRRRRSRPRSRRAPRRSPSGSCAAPRTRLIRSASPRSWCSASKPCGHGHSPASSGVAGAYDGTSPADVPVTPSSVADANPWNHRTARDIYYPRNPS